MKLVRKGNHDVGIVGTLETVPAMVYISGAVRGENGALNIQYQGNSEICWDAQETKVNDAGLRIFVDEHGEHVGEDDVELLDDNATGIAGIRCAQP
ncbi:MAG: hypothetical protein WA159_18960 [Variovorax sp.]